MPYILIALLFAIGILGAFLRIKDRAASKQSCQKPPEKESKRNVKKPQ